MAGRPQEIALAEDRNYSRADYTALRAFLNKISVERILETYYDIDDLADQGIDGTRGLRQYLEAMREDLIKRVCDEKPHLAASLQHARENYLWSGAAIAYLVQAPQNETAGPTLSDTVSRWFFPLVTKRFRDADILTLGDLFRKMKVSGSAWYFPIAGFGKERAQKVEAWLDRHEKTLGERPKPLPSSKISDISSTSLITLEPNKFVFAPFGRIRPIEVLNGQQGLLRSSLFPLISARTDIEAIDAYLKKFDDQPKTRRSYQKEIERFLMWCILEQGKAMSSVMVEDCEKYKQFLAEIPEYWVATRRTRNAEGWRPFAAKIVIDPETKVKKIRGELSAKSRQYAMTVLSTFFEFLMKVRYISGNPWVGVTKKITDKGLQSMQIEKALPKDLITKFTSDNGILAKLSQLSYEDLKQRYGFTGSLANIPLDRHFRVFKALFLTMVNTGVRREEASGLKRMDVRPYAHLEGLWEITVLGKGNTTRTVFIDSNVLSAIKDHWFDRGLNFDNSDTKDGLVPLFEPPHRPFQRRTAPEQVTKDRGYQPGGIYKLITGWFVRIARDENFDLTERERAFIKGTGVHALRHTFGTSAVDQEMPLDVIRSIMGHKSLNTTSIYTQSEKKRNAIEMDAFFTKRTLQS